MCSRVYFRILCISLVQQFVQQYFFFFSIEQCKLMYVWQIITSLQFLGKPIENIHHLNKHKAFGCLKNNLKRFPVCILTVCSYCRYCYAMWYGIIAKQSCNIRQLDVCLLTLIGQEFSRPKYKYITVVLYVTRYPCGAMVKSTALLPIGSGFKSQVRCVNVLKSTVGYWVHHSQPVQLLCSIKYQ